MNINKIVSSGKSFVKAHSSTILTVVAGVSEVIALYLTAKAAPKANERIEESNAETTLEKVKAAAPVYAAPAAFATLSIGSMIASRSITAKENAALTALVSLTENAAAQYKEKAVEVLGEKKEKNIEAAVANQIVKDTPPTATNIYNTPYGDDLFLDVYSGRYFRSCFNAIEEARVRFNDRLSSLDRDLSDPLQLNDFYEELGLPDIGVGNSVGFLPNSRMELVYGTTYTDDHTPCGTINFYWNSMPTMLSNTWR